VSARLPEGDPAAVFETLVEFERYPELVETVRSVTVNRTTPTEISSQWSVFFRKGILHWEERDQLDRDKLTVTFEQTDGDFEVMHGSWRVLPTADGCDIRFHTAFDFGVTSIESIIEPIAARVLKENVELALARLLGPRMELQPDGEAVPEGAARPRYAVFDSGAAPDLRELEGRAALAAPTESETARP